MISNLYMSIPLPGIYGNMERRNMEHPWLPMSKNKKGWRW